MPPAELLSPLLLLYDQSVSLDDLLAVPLDAVRRMKQRPGRGLQLSAVEVIDRAAGRVDRGQCDHDRTRLENFKDELSSG